MLTDGDREDGRMRERKRERGRGLQEETWRRSVSETFSGIRYRN